MDLVATKLLETELRRLAHRIEIPGAAVTAILDRITLHALPRSICTQAWRCDVARSDRVS